MSDLRESEGLIIVSAAITICLGVNVVRWVIRQLTSKLLLPSPSAKSRRRQTLPVVGYVAASASLPFGIFLGVTVGGTLGGGLGDTVLHRYGAEVGVGIGLGAVTLLVATIAAGFAMLLCALLLWALDRWPPRI